METEKWGASPKTIACFSFLALQPDHLHWSVWLADDKVSNALTHTHTRRDVALITSRMTDDWIACYGGIMRGRMADGEEADGEEKWEEIRDRGLIRWLESFGVSCTFCVKLSFSRISLNNYYLNLQTQTGNTSWEKASRFWSTCQNHITASGLWYVFSIVNHQSLRCWDNSSCVCVKVKMCVSHPLLILQATIITHSNYWNGSSAIWWKLTPVFPSSVCTSYSQRIVPRLL